MHPTRQLAPNALNQPILPNWQFQLFNLNLGISSNLPGPRADPGVVMPGPEGLSN